MNTINRTYRVIHNDTGRVVSEKNTRAKARVVYSLVGGSDYGYTLTQVTTMTTEQKIR